MTPLDKLQNFSKELPAHYGIAVKRLVITPFHELTTPQFELIQKSFSRDLFEKWLELHIELRLDVQESALLKAWIDSPYSNRPYLYDGWKQNEIKNQITQKLKDDFNFETL